VSPANDAPVLVQVDGRQLRLTNLTKVLWPEVGFTKGQMIDYYTRIAPVLLPHLHDRPLTLKRYPNGVAAEMFYEKNCPKHRPDWLGTARVWSGGNNRYMDYCTVQDLASLVWVAQLGTIELHTSLSRSQELLQPSTLVFDLDPGSPATIVECCQVGLWVRDWFAERGLHAIAKTSGSKGLQLYVPLNGDVNYEQTKLISRGLAQQLARQRPKQVIHVQRKELREGRVLIDWSQNDDSKTTINVYSLRARPRPTVSTPVTWAEVEACLEARDPGLLVFDAESVLARIEELGDLFAPVLDLKQQLPDQV
jgi:bifunctional non-homologous end joining protein LigD